MKGRIFIGDVPVDTVNFEEALDAIARLVASGRGGTVFTPNVDHVVVAEHDRRFREAYSRVSLSLVDGTPVLWAARLLGHPLPQKVSGSDLVWPLMSRAAREGWRVFLLGGAPGTAERAGDALKRKHPALCLVGTAAPHVELGPDPSARLAVAAEVAAARPNLVLVAFGAPKQEIFCDQARPVLDPAVLVCVGAGLDFVAGVARRAPPWMSRYGLEWTYRLAHEPRRLASRYLLRDPRFAAIVFRQWRDRRPREPAAP